MRKILAVSITTILAMSVAPAAHAAAPAPPTSLTVTSASTPNTALNDAAIAISWTKSVGPDLVGHQVQVTGGGESYFPQENCVDTSCSSLLDGLTGGTSYIVKVTAINTSGEIASTTAAAFTAKSSPDVPGTRTVSGVANGLTLSWAQPSSTGGLAILDYTISAAGRPDAVVSGGTTTYTAQGLTPGANYTFSIVARNSNGSSQSASFPGAVVPDVPDQPNAPQLDATGQLVSVEWVAPENGGFPITRYELQLYRGGLLVDSVAGGLDGSVTSHDFTVLTAGDYTAKVAARNAIGLSPYSAFSNSSSVSSGAQLELNVPIFTPSSLADLEIGQTQNVTASAPSGEPATLTAISSPAGTCSIAAGIVRALAPGTCTVRAVADATGTYDAGDAALTFLVKRTQTISFTTVPSQSYPGTLSLTSQIASATSNLTLSFSVSGNCTVSGSVITFTALGSCSVTANQAGNTEYFAAPSVTRSFQVMASAAGGGGAIAPSSPVLISRPQISGQAVLGEYLTTTPGVWSETPLSYTYSWYRCEMQLDSPTQTAVEQYCEIIAGATLSRYLLGTLDQGTYLLAKVEATSITSGLTEVAFSATVKYGSTTQETSSIAAYWPKRLDNSSAKLYAKNIVGAGKVQFFLNGREIAWIRALDINDKKLRVQNNSAYLVRTLKLNQGKNVLEIYVDGERVRRTIYTKK